VRSIRTFAEDGAMTVRDYATENGKERMTLEFVSRKR
jgi:hypothetical protein